MAEITAGMVKALRDKTDAPMMECKKALVEAGGDLARAEEILRVRLGNKASRAATRVAAEGVVAAHVAPDGRSGALVEVNCETDFVAKNGEFLALAAAIAELVDSRNPPSVEALGQLPFRGSTVDEARKALVGKIGENMAIRRFARMTAQGRLAVYIHGGAKIGVMADVVGGDEALAKDIAMHIAASSPECVSKDQVPAAAIAKEKEIFAEQAKTSGKPPEIIEKMVMGRVNKYLSEITLLGQAFVKDPDTTVEKLLKSKGASVIRFSRYEVGEGMEKKSGDFAAEVMATVKGG